MELSEAEDVQASMNLMVSSQLRKSVSRRRIFPIGISLAVALFLASGGRLVLAVEKVNKESPKSFSNEGAAARLNEILERVQTSHAPNLVGEIRWTSLLKDSRNSIESSKTHGSFARAVNDLFHESGVSHFHYYTRQDWDYWHLRSLFEPDNEEAYTAHVGLYSQRIDGRWFVRGILEGSVAADGPILVGDEIVSVDGKPYHPIQSFRGKGGRPTTVKLRRSPTSVFNVTLTPVKESLAKALERASELSVRKMEYDGTRIAYAHVWSLMNRGREYALLGQIQDGVEGLLLDFRDGYGGNWAMASEFLFGSSSPRRRSNIGAHWTKPVVILTDSGTRSAKEIVVHEFQQRRRGLLVGMPTPGAVTAVDLSKLQEVGNDGFLMLPMMKFDLEGHPTKPDFLVRRTIPYSAGLDPQLALGQEVLFELIRMSK